MAPLGDTIKEVGSSHRDHCCHPGSGRSSSDALGDSDGGKDQENEQDPGGQTQLRSPASSDFLNYAEVYAAAAYTTWS
jgi:hypothetical protein